MKLIWSKVACEETQELKKNSNANASSRLAIRT